MNNKKEEENSNIGAVSHHICTANTVSDYRISIFTTSKARCQLALHRGTLHQIPICCHHSKMDMLPLTKWFVIIAVVYVILARGMYHFFSINLISSVPKLNVMDTIYRRMLPAVCISRGGVYFMP